jgi:PIN domain nuclease of toxin-antitoxin system
MNDILLDTHIWIWFALEQYDNISAKAKKALTQAKRRWISAISLWELSKLVEKQRIGFSIPVLDWIRRSLAECEISVAHLEPEICVESCTLEGFHQDPADQLIVATSRVLSFPLISTDRRIKGFKGVNVIW